MADIELNDMESREGVGNGDGFGLGRNDIVEASERPSSKIEWAIVESVGSSSSKESTQVLSQIKSPKNQSTASGQLPCFQNVQPITHEGDDFTKPPAEYDEDDLSLDSENI